MVTRPRRKCERCHKIASFSYKTDKYARRCRSCKDPGMVARYYPRCHCKYSEADIALLVFLKEWRTPIRYNKHGKPARFCHFCKRAGMVDVTGSLRKKKKVDLCEEESVRKRAR